MSQRGPNRGRGQKQGRGKRAKAADPARRAAWTALRKVTTDGAYANLAGQAAFAELTERDAQFATELLNGTCRLMGTYDRIIVAASGRKLSSLQAPVLDVLRLAAHQGLSMRVPDHATVTASVDLARTVVGERVTGLVNAITRRIIARPLAEWTDDLARDTTPVEALAITTHHPAWVVQAFADALGVDPAAAPGSDDRVEIEAALAADNQAPRTALAIRPGLATVAELVDAGAEPIELVPTGAWWSGNPAQLPAVVTGRAGVQDPGSQFCALRLAETEAPAGPWLDLCAGPGGKAALLAGLAAEQDTWLLASERAPHRADLVRQGVRSYPRRPPVLVADATVPPWRPGSFAKVMADVPCSGLGALRRRPEARWRKSPADLEDLVPLQRSILTQALTALRPGGVAAYVTCSPHPAETTEVVEQVLTGPGRAELAGEFGLAGEFDVIEQHQLWPHRDQSDAMFCTLVRRVR